MNYTKRIFAYLSGAAVAALVVSILFTPALHLRAQGNAPAYTADDVSQATTLGKIISHLLASYPLWEAGKFEQATAHVKITLDELYPTVASFLKAKGVDETIKKALDDYKAVVGAAGDADQIKVTWISAQGMILQSMPTLFAVYANPQFRGETAIALLKGIEEEYAESFKDGKIADVEPYQTAIGLLHFVANDYETFLASAVSTNHADADTAIRAELDALKAVFPDMDFTKVPDTAADPATVEKSVDALVVALSKGLELAQKAAQPASEAITAIRAKVNKALEQYKAGQVDDAYETAASAYLDGFEALEADLLKKDKDLVATLETQFKALRDGIKASAPAADLDKLAASIAENLQKADALLKQA